MYYEALITFFLLAPLFYLRVIKNVSWEETIKQLLPKYKGHKKEFGGAIALFGALFIGFLVISAGLNIVNWTTNLPVNDLVNVGNVIAVSINSNMVLFILTIIIVVFAEEFFFRAFLVPRVGVILPTLLFTIFHLGYESIAETIGVFILGLILAYWYKKNNSLFQNYFGHLLYNFIAIAMYALI